MDCTAEIDTERRPFLTALVRLVVRFTVRLEQGCVTRHHFQWAPPIGRFFALLKFWALSAGVVERLQRFATEDTNE